MWRKCGFSSKFWENLLDNRLLTPVNDKFREMSKQKHNKKANKKTPDNLEDSSKHSFVSLDKSNNILLSILAKPGAKQNKITEITPEGVGVQINAPPTDGEANSELIKYISGVLGLRKTDVALERGFKSRQKTLKISGSNVDIEGIKERIKKEMEEN